MMDDKLRGYGWSLFWTWFFVSIVAISYFKYPEFRDAVDTGFHAMISGDRSVMRDWMGRLGPWGPFAVVLAMTAQMFLIVVPSFLLIVVAVLAYGPIRGLVLILASVFVASSVGYGIGRFLSPMTVERIVGPEKREKLEEYVDRYGLWVVLVTRMSPLLSSDAISFMGGLVKLKYWKFIAATVGGIAPLVGAVAYFGGGDRDFEQGLIVISVLSVVVLAVYIYLDRRRPRSN
jgi:uncharacterized membrane protein YdjX (TVP38/TMEM64 family)